MLAGVAAPEIVGTEVAVRLVAVEDVIGGDQDRVSDRDCRARGPTATPEAGILGGEVGALGPGGGFGRLREIGAEPLRAFAGLARPLAARGLVVARAPAGPRGQPPRRAEAGHVDADLGHEGFGGAAVNSRDRPEVHRLRRKIGYILPDRGRA